MTPLKITIISTLIAAATTFVTNTGLEILRNRNIRELEKQKRVWDLKAPIYMSFAEELEDLFIQKKIDVKDLEKKFNKICNKIFLVGDDEIIKQLNLMKGGSDARDDVGKVLILLRRELNKNTTLQDKDYKRKDLSISEPTADDQESKIEKQE